MLSGETASGRFPLHARADDGPHRPRGRGGEAAVAAPSRIASRARPAPFNLVTAAAACEAADAAGAVAICCFTLSGTTARLLSHFRPRVPIIAFSPDQSIRRRLALYWGVLPKVMEPVKNADLMAEMVSERLLEEGARAPRRPRRARARLAARRAGPDELDPPPRDPPTAAGVLNRGAGPKLAVPPVRRARERAPVPCAGAERSLQPRSMTAPTPTPAAPVSVETLPALQRALAEAHLDAWLLYDFHGQNPTAVNALGLARAHAHAPLVLPRAGEGRADRARPRDRARLVPGRGPGRSASGTRRGHRCARPRRGSSARCRRGARVAMEYFPEGAIPYLSRVDAGTLELVRALRHRGRVLRGARPALPLPLGRGAGREPRAGARRRSTPPRTPRSPASARRSGAARRSSRPTCSASSWIASARRASRPTTRRSSR